MSDISQTSEHNNSQSNSHSSAVYSKSPLPPLPSHDSHPRLPPHSIDAEQSLLGGVMLDERAWEKISDKVIEKDFYRYDHRLIFRCLSRLSEKNQPLDVVTVAEELNSIEELDKAGGMGYLFQLSQNTPTASNVAAYADIVRERSVLRQLITAANKISERAFKTEGADTSEILDDAEREVFAIAERSTRGSGPMNMQALLASAVKKVEHLYQSSGTVTGLSTGFDELDKLTTGLHAGELIIVAGRPSMGKTTFAMNIVEAAVIKENKPVLIFSLEMPSDDLLMRTLSSLGQIEQQAIRTGEMQDADWNGFSSAVAMLSEKKLYIDDTPSLSPTEIRARARRVARECDGLGLIMIDYLQLMQVASAENRVNEISEISRSLKALAKELNVPVIALSQLNRKLEDRNDKRPMMSDLRESGAIEQDADLIAFVYRDEVYHKDDESNKGRAEIIIGKQRNGPIGRVVLAFKGQYCRFENYTYHDDANGGVGPDDYM